ncbi:hypothetical protein H920_09086 [Fukomys damarensis]|uniref:Uncharacterized protein n=1 Tax=Fukomys damarensis TaxID=885580 RepID=A0A091DBG4_FUKDA|nr:hypothetical protein H920_09086 [Fukomys damarensis]
MDHVLPPERPVSAAVLLGCLAVLTVVLGWKQARSEVRLPQGVTESALALHKRRKHPLSERFRLRLQLRSLLAGLRVRSSGFPAPPPSRGRWPAVTAPRSRPQRSRTAAATFEDTGLQGALQSKGKVWTETPESCVE